MPRFVIRARPAGGGRLRTYRRTAESEAVASAAVAAEGLEVVGVDRDVPRPATDRQVSYLRDLRVQFPANLNIDEASSLIDNALRKREPAAPADFELATRLGVDVDRFASKDKVFQTIHSEMRARGQEHLCRWFVYRVYRSAFDRRLGDGLRDPLSPVFDPVVARLLVDDRALRSLNRQAEQSSLGFRWFGEFRGMVGESDNTLAYAAAHDGLVAAGLLALRPRPGRAAEPRVLDWRGYREMPDVSAASAPAGAGGSGFAQTVLLAVAAIALAAWLLG